MNTIRTKWPARVFVLIALMIAFYNAYNTWFKEEYSSFLTILTTFLIILAVAIQKVCESNV